MKFARSAALVAARGVIHTQVLLVITSLSTGVCAFDGGEPSLRISQHRYSIQFPQSPQYPERTQSAVPGSLVPTVPFACHRSLRGRARPLRSPCTMGSTSGATRRRPPSPRHDAVQIAARAVLARENFVKRHLSAGRCRSCARRLRHRVRAMVWGATSPSRRGRDHLAHTSACGRPRREGYDGSSAAGNLPARRARSRMAFDLPPKGQVSPPQVWVWA